ncbi:hypothetical protein GOBAR_DD11156 [Gossypium barbadense]|nr:hypothetical protein GOBAR_DD11156 [Gossypium barbadense]
MEFRPRNYVAEEQSHSLPRSRADIHPFSSSSPQPILRQVDDNEENRNNEEFFDPLRAPDSKASVETVDGHDFESSSNGNDDSFPVQTKEWTSFKRFLMQRFPVSKMISVSSMSNTIVRSGKAHEKSSSSTHLEELDDPQKFSETDTKVITQQEYVSRLHELKDEINRAWHSEDRVKSLKLSIKVSRLLMDTSVSNFYPTLFVLVTDVLNMLGDMVWERIRQKAEFAEDGARLCSLRENFRASDVPIDAKETCYNWFCKVGSIRELLPRIYLELAIFPCWRFLIEQPAESLQRLVMMTRGIGDPLASAYCRLYISHHAQKLPSHDTGYLITCLNDITLIFTRISSTKESAHGCFADSKRSLISLMEPSVEFIMKCILNDASQRRAGKVLVELGLGRSQEELFGGSPCVSIVLHHLLKDDHLKTILEGISKLASDKVLAEDELASLQSILVKLLSHFKDLEHVFSLNHFLQILDMMHGNSRGIVNMHILDMATRLCCILFLWFVVEGYLYFVFLKHIQLEFYLMLVLLSRNGYVHDPTTIQLLFEISQALHSDTDLVNMKNDDNQQQARLISRFVRMVDHGVEYERHLAFLMECRWALGSIIELKEILVHSSNCLATKALKDGKKHTAFVKTCIAFSEITIPSIPGHIKQLNLYLGTAEVALLGGLVSHSDGLIDSAINCLQSSDWMEGSRTLDSDGMLSSIRKLCSLLIMVPGNPEVGILHIPKSILLIIHSRSWSPRLKARILCAIISLSATLSQERLPYHADHPEIMGNDLLFFGDSSYVRELLSLTESVLQNLVDVIEQEPSRAARGSLSLEACNCIASSFKVGSSYLFQINEHVLSVCSKLIETAKLCLNAKDKYLTSTISFLDKNLPAAAVSSSIAI